MNLQRSFILCSYTLLTISFVMLCGTRRIDGVTAALFAAALICGWLIDTARLAWGLARRWANVLMVGGLILAIVAWQLLGVSPVGVIVHLTLFASTLKLLRWKSNRDWLWLYLVSFCLVLMTAGMTMDALFFVLLVGYLFTAALAMTIHEIRRSQLEFAAIHAERNAGAECHQELEFWHEQKMGRQRLSAPRGRRLASAAAALLVMIFALALPLFLAMPRGARGAGRGGLLEGETLTGFNDTVRLGQVAQIKLNPQVVMRVRVDFAPGETRRDLRWRGVTLDQYENREWRQTGHNPARIRKVDDLFRVDDRLWEHNHTAQQFLVEPLNINTVFAAPRPVVVMGLSSLDRDGGDGLWTEDHFFQKLNYTVYSDTSVPTDLELAGDNARNYPNEILRRYTQLPADFDRRLVHLAEEVTRGATTQLEIARRIEKHLSTSYGYSLELRRTDEGDPIADFLLNVKEGHCEYFASSMVLLLRARRIPARLVNGFQTGEYNQQADFYTVRQSDAHSWVEVFFPRHGWVTFDPTPPAGLSSYGDGWLAWLRQWREATEMMWLEHVVGFDTSKQIALLHRAQSALANVIAARQSAMSASWLGRWPTRLGDWVSRVGRWRDGNFNGHAAKINPAVGSTGIVWKVLPPLTGLAGLIGFALVLQRQRASWRRRIKLDAPASASAFYQQMLRTLARNGVQRALHQTPSELAAQLADARVAELTRLYECARFGERKLTDDEIARIEQLLRELKKR